MLPDNICVVIPTYNNSGTILQVIEDVLRYTSHLYVVCDGTTDGTEGKVRDRYWNDERLTIIGYVRNIGKGYALMKGFKAAARDGFKYAVTLDSDGQHFADDILTLEKASRKNPGCAIVGDRTSSTTGQSSGSRFANSFSNFWFQVQTSQKLPDTQSGLRLYPLEYISGVHLFTTRYEAELEMLVRMAWSGIKIVPVPVRVYYPPEKERVSHFRKGRDFTRISVLNTLLTVSALFYGYPSMLVRKLVTKCTKRF